MWLMHDNWIFHSQTQSLQYSHILFNLKMTALKQKYFGNSFDIFLILTQWFKSLYKCDIVTWWFPDFLCNYSVFITGINSIIQQYTEKADSRSTTPQFSLHNQSMVTNQFNIWIWEHYTKFSTFWLNINFWIVCIDGLVMYIFWVIHNLVLMNMYAHNIFLCITCT